MENDKWIVALCPTRDLSSVIGHLSFLIGYLSVISCTAPQSGLRLINDK